MPTRKYLDETGLEKTLEEIRDHMPDISTKQDIFQYNVMPTASVDYLNKIVQFVGSTNGTYTNGFFYKCVSDGQDPVTYSWTTVGTQAGALWGNITGTLSNQTDLQEALNGKQSTIDSSHKLDADLVDDTSSTNKFVTASDKTTWSGKQDALVSGTNIKTINNTSILGSGNIDTANVVILEVDEDMYGSITNFNTATNIQALQPLKNKDNLDKYTVYLKVHNYSWNWLDYYEVDKVQWGNEDITTFSDTFVALYFRYNRGEVGDNCYIYRCPYLIFRERDGVETITKNEEWKLYFPTVDAVNRWDQAENAIKKTTSLWTPSYNDLGKIYQYQGTTDDNYIKGYFYICVQNPSGSGYIWQKLDTTDISGKADQSTTYTKTEVDNLIPDVSNFITNTVNNLTNYYLKTETYTQTEVNNLISAVSSLDIQVVQTLPVTDISTSTIYLVPKASSQTQNVYDEYIYVSDGASTPTYSWEKIGDTEIDLSDYVTTTELSTALADYTTTTDLTTLLSGKQSTIDSSHKISADLVDDSSATNKFVTASDKTAWNNKYDKPSSGIPDTDLSSAVQTSLGKADTALQSETDPVFSASAASGITSSDITNWNNKSDFSGSYNDLTDKPTIPDELSDLSDDSTHRLVTDTEKSTWSGKQDLIDSSHKLSSDLVDDTNHTNKFINSSAQTFTGTKTFNNGIYSTSVVTDSLSTFDRVTFNYSDYDDSAISFTGHYGDDIYFCSGSKAVFGGGAESSVTPTTGDDLTNKTYVDGVVSGKENTSNKVTSLSSSSTDTQYPSAKCVYDAIPSVEACTNSDIDGLFNS